MKRAFSGPRQLRAALISSNSDRQLYVASARVETVGMFCTVVSWWSAVAEVVLAVSRIARSGVTHRARVRGVLAVQSQTTNVINLQST